MPLEGATLSSFPFPKGEAGEGLVAPALVLQDWCQLCPSSARLCQVSILCLSRGVAALDTTASTPCQERKVSVGQRWLCPWGATSERALQSLRPASAPSPATPLVVSTVPLLPQPLPPLLKSNAQQRGFELFYSGQGSGRQQMKAGEEMPWGWAGCRLLSSDLPPWWTSSPGHFFGCFAAL